MAGPTPLAVESLRTPCRLDGLEFTTTADLPALPDSPGVLGQDRAREAVELAVGLRGPAAHVFVLGPTGLGKRTLVREILETRAATGTAPADWCYVNNVAQPYRPRALRLPRGQGSDLRRRIRQFAEDARASIPALFDSDEYRTRAEQIDAEVSERQQAAFVALGREAAAESIALLHTPAGFSLAPAKDGEVMTPEQFAELPEAERERLAERLKVYEDRLAKVIRQVQSLQKEKRAAIKDLGREMCSVTVAALMDEVRQAYAGLPAVLAYLDEVRADVLENLEEFRRPDEPAPGPLGMVTGGSEPGFLRRYDVNVVVGDHEAATAGAPVVSEDHPTYQNLLGRVEYVARFGTLVTDFTQIKPGALHRANGGYLLLDAHRLLTQPFAWDGLKRALRTGEIRTEALGQTYGMINTVALEPEPIPLDVTVVLFGERLLYHLLLAYDREFGELFRIPADFEDEIDRTADHESLYARLVATIAGREGWLPLARGAVVAVIEELARWSGDGEHLSTRIADLTAFLREVDHRARADGATATDASHVAAAVRARRRRSGRIREKIHEAITRGDLLIDTAGSAVGQVNGLSVASSADQAFAFPTRITANTRMGDGAVLDIQREVDLSGPIHSKGVLILASLLTARYSPDRPPPLAATLVFEQTYGTVDGDSASVAELCALLSSLGGFPLDQRLAVTGAVDQHGRVLPIGAVNEKVEGFYDVCVARGLSGDQGVVIPRANVRHLMLRQDVVAAVARGGFRVVAVDTVDDTLAALSGLEAGTPDDDGAYPADSANGRVAARVADLAEKRRQLTQEALATVQQEAAPSHAAPAQPTPVPPSPEPPSPEPPGPPSPGPTPGPARRGRP